MTAPSFAKAGIMTLILVAGSLLSWESYVRSKGFDRSYDDGGPLWSNNRAMVYEPADKSTVFIGSSRIKFDLDIPTWESITGDHAIQLACVGSTPIPILQDLANDRNFKGKLVVDVTEPIFFSVSPNNAETPTTNIKYYKDQTPAQRVSFRLDHLLESQFAFLDKDRLSLNESLINLRIPNRPGVFQFPIFPPDFGRSKFSRQEYMTEKFVQDTAQQNQVKGVWNFFRSLSKDPPASGDKLDSILLSVKTAVDKIKARGGQVLFVRTPSSGPMLMGENMGFPREKYWERLIAYCNCPGIHFADHPAIAHFECPELSHLKQPDAILFTKEFIRILGEDNGWKFPAMNNTAN
ncbi:hypothetical protein BH11BAC4_BH11BAC4_13080 [soil metagenome]